MSASYSPSDPAEISKLAEAKGCTLNTMRKDGVLMYWVESNYFVGKPYHCLEELRKLIQKLPLQFETHSSTYPYSSGCLEGC